MIFPGNLTEAISGYFLPTLTETISLHMRKQATVISGRLFCK